MNVSAYLKSDSIVDWQNPEVLARATAFREGSADDVEVARRCFEWVRDEIRHTQDYGLSVVTCTASDVLREGSGYCYAKAHLLAALLRANGIPAGLCYQRLSLDEHGVAHCLHGLNAVLLPGIGWYRVDPRGNRGDVAARFEPPFERLAFRLTLPGEMDLPEVWADPLQVVIDALTSHGSADVLANNLPDIALWTSEQRT